MGTDDQLSLLSADFLKQIDDLGCRFPQNSPCPHVTIDRLLNPEFCAQLVREFPQYDDAVLERFKANGMQRGKSKKQDIRELGGAFLASMS